MRVLRLVIKGDRFQAAAAAAKRRIPFAFSTTLPGHADPATSGYVGTQHESKVEAWLLETDGELLSYTITERNLPLTYARIEKG